MGAERYRGRASGEHRAAGVRTFAIFCLLGAVAGILDSTVFTAITFLALAGLVMLGYQRSPAGSLGLTTEVAALLVFWIGFLLSSHEAAAVSLGVILTIFLASKRELHRFVKHQLSETEFEATLRFLAVVLVIYPVLPDRRLGPFGFFSPREAWGFVILVSAIGYAGYFLVRWLGRRRGQLLASLGGGLVSTTATTLTLARQAREDPSQSRSLGVHAVLANSVQGPRLLLLVWIVAPALARTLAWPLLAMTAAGLVGAWLLARRLEAPLEVDIELTNPFSVWPALRFAGFFVAVLFVVRWGEATLGEIGIVLASAVSGLASTSAVGLSVANAFANGTLAPGAAAGAVLIAIAVNSVSKVGMALLYGTGRMTLWLAGGLVTMLTAAALLLFLLPTGGSP